MGQFKFVSEEKKGSSHDAEAANIRWKSCMDRWIKHFDETGTPAAIIKSKGKYSLWRVTEGTTERTMPMPANTVKVADVHKFWEVI